MADEYYFTLNVIILTNFYHKRLHGESFLRCHLSGSYKTFQRPQKIKLILALSERPRRDKVLYSVRLSVRSLGF